MWNGRQAPVKIVKRILIALAVVLQVIVFSAAAVKPAHAYVDPGSGLLAFQIGGSMLAGALFFVRAKIRKLFRRDKPKPESAESIDASLPAGPEA
jgi:hypothetical protein